MTLSLGIIFMSFPFKSCWNPKTNWHQCLNQMLRKHRNKRKRNKRRRGKLIKMKMNMESMENTANMVEKIKMKSMEMNQKKRMKRLMLAICLQLLKSMICEKIGSYNNDISSIWNKLILYGINLLVAMQHKD